MRLHGMAAALSAAFVIAAPAAGAEDARAVLARVRGYVEWYDRQLLTLIADERYVQSSGGQASESANPSATGSASRVLESEFGWVAVPALQDTVGVREVHRVDGLPVGSALRLRALLAHPPEDPSADVRAILAESATHNIGNMRRNINFPTFALAYLRDPREHDTRWHVVRSGGHVRLEFEERDRSTLVRTPEGRRIPARGRFTIDPASGRIRACELRVRVRDGRSSHPMVYWMLVDFAADPRLDLWVPVRMLERQYRDAAGAGNSGDAGEATYANYRRYETGGRLIQ